MSGESTEKPFDPEEWKSSSWTNDEGETVTIDEILTYLESQPTVEINVPELLKQLKQLPQLPILEPQRIEYAQLKHPIILLKKEGKIRLVLDGNHRLQRAINEEKEEIHAKILDLDSPDVPPKFLRILENV